MSGGDRFAGVSWPKVLRGLTFEAIRLFQTVGLGHGGAVLVGVGVSPEDLAMATLTKLLDPDDRSVVYRGGEASVLTFLKAVMKNDFLDLLKRKAHETTDILDSTPNDQEDDPPRSLDSLPGKVAEGTDVIFRGRLRELASDDGELVEYIDAVFLFDDALLKPEDIVSLLGTTTTDIQNRKKRLNTILATHPEFREAFKR